MRKKKYYPSLLSRVEVRALLIPYADFYRKMAHASNNDTPRPSWDIAYL